MSGRFARVLRGELPDAPPIWLMRQAGRRSWICGLGHGVLPGTPESSVRIFVRLAREAFA